MSDLRQLVLLSLINKEDMAKKTWSLALEFSTNIKDYSWVDDKILGIRSFYTDKNKLELKYCEIGLSSDCKVCFPSSDMCICS